MYKVELSGMSPGKWQLCLGIKKKKKFSKNEQYGRINDICHIY